MARINKTKELLSAFGDRYATFENNGGYCLYDKEKPCKRANFSFLGKFYISTDKTSYVFNDTNYKNVESLISAMDEYNKTLPFSAEIYDPIYKKNYQIECALHDYLTSLGFEMSWKHLTPFYTFKDVYGEIVLSLSFEVKEDTTEGKLTRYISNGDKYSETWIDAPFHDMDSAIGACNTMISTYCALLNSKMMNVLNSLTKSRSAILLKKTFDVATLTEYTEDNQKKVIQYLEEELKRLKGE